MKRAVKDINVMNLATDFSTMLSYCPAVSFRMQHRPCFVDTPLGRIFIVTVPNQISLPRNQINTTIIFT